MRPKAIFFDVDGTMISLDVAIKTFQDTCRHFKIGVLANEKLLKKAIGYRLSETIENIIPEAVPIVKDFMKYFEEKQIENIKKHSTLLPFVKLTIDFLYKSGIKIGIVTTKKRSEALAVLERFKLHYNTLVAGDDVRNRKPHPEPILKACENLELNPRYCVFVGDHPFDMQAAVAAGCLPIGVLTGWGNTKNLKDAGAKYIIKNLKELIKLIDR